MVRTGKYLSNGPSNYKIPSIFDIPNEFNVSLLRDSYNSKVSYGSKALGEAPVVLGNVVMLAIRNAVSAEVQTPATVMNIWKATQ